jgi:hypothetical protein
MMAAYSDEDKCRAYMDRCGGVATLLRSVACTARIS